MLEFQEILAKYREEALSQREKGGKFEALIQRYLLTDRKYAFTKVWLWGEFPYRQSFGGQDIGIDLVALMKPANIGRCSASFMKNPPLSKKAT